RLPSLRCFFFSSRRRHTRSKRDWSSDVCSSDLLTPAWPWLHDYLTGTAARVELLRLIQPTLFVSLVLVGAGFALGIWMYRKAGEIGRASCRERVEIREGVVTVQSQERSTGGAYA